MIDLNKKYESSVRENEGYKYKLAEEYEKRTNILKDKAKLEKDLSEASRLLIMGLTIKGIGITTNLLGKSKEIETDKANKIKKIRIELMLPYNSFAVKEAKHISVILNSLNKKEELIKDTTVNYVGNLCNIRLDLKPDKEFNTGKHNISIKINNKLQTEEIFNITK